MGPLEGFIGVMAILALMAMGVPIFLSLFMVGLIGYALIVGIDGLNLLQIVPYRETAVFTLAVLPLFILMGEIASYTDVAKDAYRAAHTWFGHLPGGLGMAAIAADVLFAATSGSGMAATATIGAASVPEMRKYHYNPGLSAALVACGGTLASMIPPSSIIIVYGVFTDTSIGALLLGGIGPGLLQAFMYVIGLYLIARFRPKLMPAGPHFSWKERFSTLPGIWPFILIIVMLMGGLYLGVFTPTEAASFGAAGMIIIAAIRQRLSRQNMSNALLQSGRVTSMTFLIIIGAMVFSYFLTLTGLPAYIIGWVAELNIGPYPVMIAMMFMYVILGCFLPSMPMLMLTLPVTFPLAINLGFDPVLFGILCVTMAEMSAYTPPMAFNLFVAHSIVPDIPFADVCKSVIPFVIIDWVRTLVILYFPQIVLFIPTTMKKLGS